MKSPALWIVRSCVVIVCIFAGSWANSAPQQGTTSPQASARTLPPDIDPDSRNRLPRVRREDLDDAGKKVYDAVAGDSRLLGLDGPIGIRMHSPPVSEYMTMGNRYLRFEAGIEPRLMELAILVGRARDEQPVRVVGA